ncbi:MAG: cell wall metabolism sensor histidine kinase WalK [Clostridia bacterium]|nr:cell wall metabolism sensor histidine kinase WalK [Clostridia bacterium]
MNNNIVRNPSAKPALVKFSLRNKIIITNLVILVSTFLVISIAVVEGSSRINRNMILKNLMHQADLSVISIKQTLLSAKTSSLTGSEFNARSRDFAHKLSAESGLRVLIFSTTKAMIADSGNTWPENTVYTELDEVLKGNRTWVTRKYAGVQNMHFSFPVILSGNKIIGEIMFIHPMDEANRLAGNIQLLLVLAFAAGIIIVVSASIIFSLKITTPILQLKKSAVDISNGDFKGKINVKSSDEIGELGNAFNTMASEVEKRIEIIDFERVKLNSILDSMGEGVLAFDSRENIILINSKAKSMMDSTITQGIHAICQNTLRTNSRTITEIDSDNRNLLVCATPLKTSEKADGAVMVLNDITELRLLQEKQRQFITNVSHELKTPLTTILGYIDLLKSEGNDKTVFDTSIQYLEGASDRLLRLISDLIDLSSLNKSEFEIELKSTDISALIRDITGQMSLKAQKFNITLEVDIPQNIRILADHFRVKQALVNVLDNAIKYSPQSIINVTLTSNAKGVVIAIKDSGCGIPPDMLENVFQPFYRVDKARSRNMGGNGLGLSITKEIIEKHGGAIEINSVEGKGTEVLILLPK